MNVDLPGRVAVAAYEIELVGVALLVESSPEVTLPHALRSQFTAHLGWLEAEQIVVAISNDGTPGPVTMHDIGKLHLVHVFPGCCRSLPSYREHNAERFHRVVFVNDSKSIIYIYEVI